MNTSEFNWARVSDEEKAGIGYVDKDNGEFWISLEDFKKEFSAITICTAGPDSNCDGEADAVNAEYLLLSNSS